jgi:uncharacterized repeat protein (TIGR03803 family)
VDEARGPRCHLIIVGVAIALLAGCGETPHQVGASGAIPNAISAVSGSYKVLYNFQNQPDGADPSSGLLELNRRLYGTTYEGGNKDCWHHLGCGTVYRISSRGAEKVLHVFIKPDAVNPSSSLIDVKGTLYGTTVGGGSSGGGTVFSMTPRGTETVLHSFGGRNDGRRPDSHLINVNGTLYGTTTCCGKQCSLNPDCGTVYSISPSGKERVIYFFRGGSDGAVPNSLVYLNGMLYGTTLQGGVKQGCKVFYYIFGCGTFFSLTTSGKHTVLHEFSDGSDGAQPLGGLLDVNGTLYGTTESGGSENGGSGRGIVYSMSTSGVETILYRFTGGSDGLSPNGGLIDVGSVIFGTTFYGGGTSSICTNGCGTIYSITMNGGESVENVLYRFAGGTGGMYPNGDLIDVKGTLYGTTRQGGVGTCCGTVFALTP